MANDLMSILRKANQKIPKELPRLAERSQFKKRSRYSRWGGGGSMGGGGGGAFNFKKDMGGRGRFEDDRDFRRKRDSSSTSRDRSRGLKSTDINASHFNYESRGITKPG